MDWAKSSQIPGQICSSEDLSDRGWIHSKPIFIINIQVWLPITVVLQTYLQKFYFYFSFVALHMELWVEEFHMTEDSKIVLANNTQLLPKDLKMFRCWTIISKYHNGLELFAQIFFLNFLLKWYFFFCPSCKQQFQNNCLKKLKGKSKMPIYCLRTPWNIHVLFSCNIYIKYRHKVTDEDQRFYR